SAIPLLTLCEPGLPISSPSGPIVNPRVGVVKPAGASVKGCRAMAASATPIKRNSAILLCLIAAVSLNSAHQGFVALEDQLGTRLIQIASRIVSGACEPQHGFEESWVFLTEEKVVRYERLDGRDRAPIPRESRPDDRNRGQIFAKEFARLR